MFAALLDVGFLPGDLTLRGNPHAGLIPWHATGERSDEVVSQVFVAVLTSPSPCRLRVKALPWLYAFARHKVLELQAMLGRQSRAHPADRVPLRRRSVLMKPAAHKYTPLFQHFSANAAQRCLNCQGLLAPPSRVWMAPG